MSAERRSESFSIATTGSDIAVRAALAESRARLADMGVSAAVLGTVELALAEALNNIAEHAYAGTDPGPVRILARRTEDELQLRLLDRGHPLPGGSLPEGRLPDADGPRDSLPEGGFGWFLIRDLTQSVSYCRESGENRLDLVFALNHGEI